MKLKTTIISVVVSASLVAGVGYGAYYAMRGEKPVIEVVPVANVNQGSYYWGMSDTVYGTVTSQVSQRVELNDEYSVAEVYVEEGDYVTEGTPLFAYDMTLEELELQLEELSLQTQELTQMRLEKELDKLKKTKTSASLEYNAGTLTAAAEEGDAIIDDSGSAEEQPSGEQTDGEEQSEDIDITIEGIETEEDPGLTDVETEEDALKGIVTSYMLGINELFINLQQSDLSAAQLDAMAELMDQLVDTYHTTLADSVTSQETQEDGTVKETVSYEVKANVSSLLTESEMERLEDFNALLEKCQVRYINVLIREAQKAYGTDQTAFEEAVEQIRQEYDRMSTASQEKADCLEQLLTWEELIAQGQETETDTEQSTEADSEGSTEGGTEADSEDSTEGGTEADSEDSTEGSTEADSEDSTEGGTEADSEDSTEGGTEADSEDSTEGGTEADSEDSTEGGTEADSEDSTEGGTEADSEDSTEGGTEADSEESSEDSSEENTESGETESEIESETESETESESESESESETSPSVDLNGYISSYLELSEIALAEDAKEQTDYLNLLENALIFYQQWIAQPQDDILDESGAEPSMSSYILKTEMKEYLKAEGEEHLIEELEASYKEICMRFVQNGITSLNPQALEREDWEKAKEAYESLGESWQIELEQRWMEEQESQSGEENMGLEEDGDLEEDEGLEEDAAGEVYEPLTLAQTLQAYEMILIIEELNPEQPEELLIPALESAYADYLALNDSQKLVVWNSDVLLSLLELYGLLEQESESEWYGEDDYFGDWGDFGDGYTYTAEELKSLIEDKEQEIKESSLTIREMELSVEKRKRVVDGKVVKSTLDGTVVSIGEGESDYFVEVTNSTGLYAKGVISELALESVNVGDTITGMSYDNYMSFTAVIKEVSAYPDPDGMYMSYGSGNTNAAYYPFYALIENTEGISEGDVELTLSSDDSAAGESIYLENFFIRTGNDGKSYVYIQGEDGKLKKQTVTTGKRLYSYATQIVSGLTLEDKIAFPYGNNVKEGADTEVVDVLQDAYM